MLVGGTGIGYYVWNEWNNLDLTSVIFSILIGVVGMLLDMLLSLATRLVQYEEWGCVMNKYFLEIENLARRFRGQMES